MSILLMSQIWQLKNLEPTEKLVLLAIADFSNDNGISWPSIRTIAEKSSLSVDTVRRKLSKFEKIGHIVIERRKANELHQTHIFKLFPNPSANPEFSPNTSPNVSISDGTSTVRVLAGCKEGTSNGHTPYIEPSLKHNMFSDFFETLWRDYPAKDGKKKAMAHFKATVKSEADCQRIKKALDNYLAMLKRDTWRTAKNGDTWFNNWQDWEACPPAPHASASRPAAGSGLEELRAKGIDV